MPLVSWWRHVVLDWIRLISLDCPWPRLLCRFGLVPASSIFGWTPEATNRFRIGYRSGARFVPGGQDAAVKQQPATRKRKKRASALDLALGANKTKKNGAKKIEKAAPIRASNEAGGTADQPSAIQSASAKSSSATQPCVSEAHRDIAAVWRRDADSAPSKVIGSASTEIPGLHPNRFADLVYGGPRVQQQSKKLARNLAKAIELGNACYTNNSALGSTTTPGTTETLDALRLEVFDDLEQNLCSTLACPLFLAYEQAEQAWRKERLEMTRARTECQRALNRYVQVPDRDVRFCLRTFCEWINVTQSLLAGSSARLKMMLVLNERGSVH